MIQIPKSWICEFAQNDLAHLEEGQWFRQEKVQFKKRMDGESVMSDKSEWAGKFETCTNSRHSNDCVTIRFYQKFSSAIARRIRDESISLFHLLGDHTVQ